MASIKIENIRKSFDATEVLHGVDIDIDDGEFVVFVGPSGCGKSTLLRLIAGLDDITSGQLCIDGEVVNEMTPKERGIAMVFQSYALYPHMTVYKNMAFGLKIANSGRAEIDRRVREAAAKLELGELLDRRPAQLSGGQRQRVAIGRAIVRNPRVFLFDEPLSNLDAALRVQTRLEIAKLHEELGNTIIYVTHDQVEAMTLADKIVVLSEGNVEQVGTPLDLYHHPRNRFVAGFIGSPKMNFISGECIEAGERSISVGLDGGRTLAIRCVSAPVRPGLPLTLGVRPEHLTEGAGGAIEIEARVELVERLGDVSYLYLRLDDATQLIASTRGTSRARSGQQITVTANVDAVHVFDPDSVALERTDLHPDYMAAGVV